MIDHKPDNNDQYDPSLMDTQRLLLGVQLPEDGSYDLDEILAEFSSKSADAASTPEEPSVPDAFAAGTPPEPEPSAEAAPPAAGPEPVPEPEPKPARKRFSWSARPPKPVKPEEPPKTETPPEEPPSQEPAPIVEDDAELTEEDLLDLAFWNDEELPDIEAAVSAAGAPETPPAAEPPAPTALVRKKAPPKKTPLKKAPPEKAPPEDPAAVSVEDVVANTVDAVKVEQEKHQERLRKRLEKLQRQSVRRPKPKEPAARQPLPELEREPAAAETANRHKRKLRQCRRNLFPAVLALILLWLPWILTQSGAVVPFFSASADNAALCVLIFQAVICILCWPVYRMAVFSMREGSWTIYATALLSTGVTLLDEMTMLLLPGRTDAPPLGGVAACLSVFALWGLTSWHKGMAETFRIAAMGEPTRVVDHTPHGTAKGRGGSQGFYTRAMMEDTASQWQRLLLPVLAAASLVFAGLASVGQDRPQDFLWCWSAVLCAASSPVFLLAYCVPFGRVAAHLARDGAAVAGMYGAAVLSADLRLAVTDADLFPAGSAVLGGMKLYGEERERALSYAGSLASQGGGLPDRAGDSPEPGTLSYP